MRCKPFLTATFAAVTIAVSGATAAGASLDVSSTAHFLGAANALLTVAVAKHSQEEAGANAVIAHVSATCPGALGSVVRGGTKAQRRTASALVYEGFSEVALAQNTAIRSSAAQWVRALGGLHWTVPAINSAVASTLRKDQEALALRPPDLCAEIRAAAANGFAALPRDATRFLKRAAAINNAPSVTRLAAMMKPFISGGENRSLTRVRNLYAQLQRLNGQFGPGAGKRMLHALTGS